MKVKLKNLLFKLKHKIGIASPEEILEAVIEDKEEKNEKIYGIERFVRC